jgi:hypothetical protein
MSGTVVEQNLKKETAAASKTGPLKGKKAAAKSKESQPKVGALPQTQPPTEDPDKSDSSFLDDLGGVLEYILKINPSCRAIQGYKEISLFAGARGSVEIQNKAGKLSLMARWSAFRKLIKAQEYKSRKLAPRPSDTDFQGSFDTDPALEAFVRDDESAVQSAPALKENTDEEVAAALHEIAPVACQMLQYFRTNKAELEISTHISAAMASSRAMGQVVPLLGGPPREQESIRASCLQVCLEETLRELPNEYLLTWSLLNNVKPEQLERVVASSLDFQNFVNIDIAKLKIDCIRARFRLLGHLATQLGGLPVDLCALSGSIETGVPVLKGSTIGSDMLMMLARLMVAQKFDGGSNSISLISLAGQYGFTEVVHEFTKSAIQIGENVASPAAKAFADAQKAIARSLAVMNASALTKYCHDESLNISVQDGVDVFPSEKTKAVDLIVAESWKAAIKKEQEGALSAMHATYDNDRKLALVLASIDKVLRPPAEVPAGPLLQAVGGDDGAVGAEEEDTTTIIRKESVWEVGTWLGELKANELKSQPLTAHGMRLLIHKMQGLFLPQGVAPNQGSGFDKVHIMRTASGKIELAQREEGQCYFNLWGTVVDETAAGAVPKQFLLPLGCSENVRLYLDGSRFANVERSDCCLGWLVAQYQREEATIPL